MTGRSIDHATWGVEGVPDYLFYIIFIRWGQADLIASPPNSFRLYVFTEPTPGPGSQVDLTTGKTSTTTDGVSAEWSSDCPSIKLRGWKIKSRKNCTSSTCRRAGSKTLLIYVGNSTLSGQERVKYYRKHSFKLWPHNEWLVGKHTFTIAERMYCWKVQDLHTVLYSIMVLK